MSILLFVKNARVFYFYFFYFPTKENGFNFFLQKEEDSRTFYSHVLKLWIYCIVKIWRYYIATKFSYMWKLYNVKVKSSSLAYNRHETQDKRPLCKNSDKSWCHRHTNVKLFWSHPMAPWTSTAAYEWAATQFMDPWDATKKALY